MRKTVLAAVCLMVCAGVAQAQYHNASYGHSYEGEPAPSSYNPASYSNYPEYGSPVDGSCHEFGSCQEDCFSDCTDGCDSGSWKWYGEFLLVKPTVDDTYFAISSPISTGFPNGTRVNNDFGFEPGFRIGAQYEGIGDEADFQIDYTWIETDTSRAVAGDFLWATNGRADLTSSFENYGGTAASQLDVSFHRLNAQFFRPINVLGANVSFLYGVEIASMDYDQSYEYVNGGTTGNVRETAESWGVGPKVGLSGDHVIGENFSGTWSLTWMSAVSLLAGESEGTAFNAVNGAELLNVVDESTTRIIPALHARLGLSYSRFILERPACLTFGYEFNSYLRAIQGTDYPDDVADGLTATTYNNFDLQGFFLNLTILN